MHKIEIFLEKILISIFLRGVLMMNSIAKVKIKGTRPFLFNNFSIERIPLKRTTKGGVAGNNPEEWKSSYRVTEEGQLYIEPNYIFSCLRAGGKYIPKSRGSLESDVAATVQVISEKILLDRYVISQSNITTDSNDEVYIDVRPVSRRGVKNIRYRLATQKGWETEFVVKWDSTLISPEQLHSICIEAGSFAGLGDGRKIGFGRFEVISFEQLNQEENKYA
ncbi:hypothetical protein [Robertmurraya sp. P23]|uniref:hypothetical protein n=1 Tax=Robertmurraya sp. P23 TaxID=3436931 RepID=UPI003D9570E8